MSRINLVSGDLREATRKLSRISENVHGARSPELAAAAKVLRRSVARQISKSGGGRIAQSIATKRRRVLGAQRSQPGEPPRRQTGRLRRSVIQGVVETGRRVAVMAFTAPLLERGVPDRALAPRPFMQRGLDACRNELTGVVVKANDASVARAMQAA